MSKLIAALGKTDNTDDPAAESPAAIHAAAPQPAPEYHEAVHSPGPQPDTADQPGTTWWIASDGNWYPPEARRAAPWPGWSPPGVSNGPAVNADVFWSGPANRSHPSPARHRAVAIFAVIAVLGLVATAMALRLTSHPTHIATAPAPNDLGATHPRAPDQLPANAVSRLQSVTLDDLGGTPWTSLGGGKLTAYQLTPSPPCPGQPEGWGQDLSGTDSEFTYQLAANGKEAGHLVSTVVLTSSADAAARRLLYRQSEINIPCIERSARETLANPEGDKIVPLTTTRASLQSVEPAAMWRVKATLSRPNGQQFVLFQDAVRIVDGPYLVILRVNACGCLADNPNPTSELLPGETKAIVAMGQRLHDLLGH